MGCSFLGCKRLYSTGHAEPSKQQPLATEVQQLLRRAHGADESLVEVRMKTLVISFAVFRLTARFSRKVASAS